ncbi:Oidioi.mRNA.OKI2018_I69.chr2.g6551.t1.cds [Oikopleura dioica]|uniref:Oidioi.mRNA.OKI2018_I69.chr2.g6551.t1.cds n=1 Tax=Oikopleura dioica TaxID=34765 RepID=A0ABN7T3E1_OIKDI|nr:Oidioi.mRNA.OKI2018_I69.chr2.g6551.t1.cds [Oikopleura dioica]
MRALQVLFGLIPFLYAKRPNIVFILTDDLDVAMGGMTPLEKTRRLLGEAGATFSNAFASTPICCPSRSTILSGRYQHNTKVLNNTVDGNCSSQAWQDNIEPSTIGARLQPLGYKTFYAGKYLNMYGLKRSPGGVGHVPKGWDSWNALVGNSRYYNYSISRNGKEEKHGDDFNKDYLTNLVANDSVAFINSMKADTPFFMIVAPPAPHEPWDSDPKYADLYQNLTAPRDNQQWNIHRADAHWVVRNVPNPMSETSTKWSDNAYRSRWRCLKSVDDLVESIMNALNETQMLDDTYIMFSSDHGYHTGQFSLPYDKRQPYEFDLRIPLLIRGPNVKPNSTIPYPVSTVDFAPTILDLANQNSKKLRFEDTNFDGESFKTLLNGSVDTSWRQNLLIEYHGEGLNDPATVYNCPGLGPGVSECVPDCVCDDASNNTFACVRRQIYSENLNLTDDLVYCEFVDKENFIEVYNLIEDPAQLKNLRGTLDPTMLEDLNMQLIELSSCTGEECSTLDVPPFRVDFDRTHEKEETIQNDHIF